MHRDSTKVADVVTGRVVTRAMGVAAFGGHLWRFHLAARGADEAPALLTIVLARELLVRLQGYYEDCDYRHPERTRHACPGALVVR